MWYLTNPAPGTQTITVTLSGSTQMVAGALSFEGVDQTTPFGTVATAAGTGLTPLVTVSSSAGQIVVDTLALSGNLLLPPLPGLLQEQHWNEDERSGGSPLTGAASTKNGTGTTTMSWTAVSLRPWTMVGAAVRPAACAQ
jgi:hypothetical protein